MAASAPKSLDEMLQADRKKRKAEKLAQKIFGNKDRRQSAPATEKTLKPQSPGASFASRVGINKRSVSSSSVNRQKPSARPNAPSALSRSATVAKLETFITDNGQAPSGPKKKNKPKQSNGQSKSQAPVEISVRGAAGPYTVVAENFAPETTAEDIETVVSNIGGPVESCRLVRSDAVSVAAEMVFLDKKKVDEVISTFHGKKADGYELNVYLKKPGRDSANGLSEVNPWRVDPEPATYTEPAQPAAVDDQVMEVDHGVTEPVYMDDRARRDDYDRQDRHHRDEYAQHFRRDDRRHDRRGDRRDDRRPDLMYQDGRYGFDDQPPAGPRYNRRQEPFRGGRGGGRMYSDDIMRQSGPSHSRRW